MNPEFTDNIFFGFLPLYKQTIDLIYFMKKTITTCILIIIIICIWSCSSEEANNNSINQETLTNTEASLKEASSTVQELGEAFFLTVKNNDKTLIETSLPSKQDVIDIMGGFKGSEKQKKDILKRSEDNTKQIRRNSISSIKEIINKGKKNGIDWSQCSYSNSILKVKKENNIEFASLLIHFQYNNQTYSLKIPECIKSERGWLIFDKPKWIGK